MLSKGPRVVSLIFCPSIWKCHTRSSASSGKQNPLQPDARTKLSHLLSFHTDLSHLWQAMPPSGRVRDLAFCASPQEPLLSLKLPSLVMHTPCGLVFLFRLFLGVSHPCPHPHRPGPSRSLLKGCGHVTALWSSAMLLHTETGLSFSRGDLRVSFSSAKDQLTLENLSQQCAHSTPVHHRAFLRPAP